MATTELDREINKRVRLRREQLDLSREAVGASIGVTHQQISNYENGRHRLSVGSLITMCKGPLQCPPSFIIGDLGTPEAKPTFVPSSKALKIAKAFESAEPTMQSTLLIIANAILKDKAQ